jgi:hypothetical protein
MQYEIGKIILVVLVYDIAYFLPCFLISTIDLDTNTC